MKAKITLIGPGGSLTDVVIDVHRETDNRISDAIVALAKDTPLAIGDTITITEIE